VSVVISEYDTIKKENIHGPVLICGGVTLCVFILYLKTGI